MCVLRVWIDYSSAAAFEGKVSFACPPAGCLSPASCVREDGLNAGMGYQLVLRTKMNYRCAISVGGLSLITSVLPLTAPVRREEWRVRYTISSTKKTVSRIKKKN